MKTKRFFQIWLNVVLAFLIALACGTVAACGETVVEGPETGVYYYQAEEDEYLVTLYDGNKFTLTVEGKSKTGQYVLNGEAMTLTFTNQEDGQTTATLKDGKLTLNYNDSEIRFLKKVSYSVTYNSNGGSAVAAQTVLNGKTVSKPADPTRDGYGFRGWFIDAECSDPFLFGTQIVTSDITLYAGWGDGKTGFTVTYDLNYEGAPAMETAQTYGGVLYDVPTPTRSGYIFCGWWISAFEDVNKLSYAYADGMVFDANTTLFALWMSEEAGTKLDAPLVNVTSNAISWEGVVGAQSYALEVTGPEGFKAINKPVNSTSESMDFASLPAGDYTIKVTAKAAVEANDSDTTVRVYKNKALARVSQFSVVEPSRLLFNAVANAEEYLITIECGTEGHSHVAISNGASTNYDFANCTVGVEGIKFIVTARANGYASSESTVFVHKRNLESVELSFDEATQTLSWDEVENATNYILSVNYNGETKTVDLGGKTSYNFKEYGTGKITVNVYPKTKGYNSPAASSYEYEKSIIATPGDIRIKDTTLSWADVGATSYSIKIGDTVINSETNSIDIANVIKWIDGNDYKISIRANGTTESLWSDEYDVRYYAMYDSLSYNQNVVSWRAVVGATKYEVMVNGGKKYTVNDGSNSFGVTFTQAGKNVISVRYYDGIIYSDWAELEVYAHTLEFDSRLGNGVAPQYLAVGDKITLPTADRNGYEFAGWYNAPNGPQGNGAPYVDEYFYESGDMEVYAYWTPKQYTVTYADGTTVNATDPVGYRQDYKLEIPTTDDGTKSFAGWYTLPGGQGTRLTDDEGNSLAVWNYTEETTVYAFWTEVFKFTKLLDGTYAVSKGPNISLVSHVTIPAYYDDTIVSTVSGYAFKECYYLYEVNIPNTVSIIESETAFYRCSRIEAVNIYEVEGNHEVFYESYDGVLLYHNPLSKQIELNYFPTAKTGAYSIPNVVTSIPYKLFSGSKVKEVTIPSSVVEIAESAFFNCANLSTVTFTAGGATELFIADGAFQNCVSLATVSFPARLADLSFDEETNALTVFEGCSALRSINVANGNAYFGSIDGVLTDADQKTILYCPDARRGSYTVPTGITAIADRAFEDCVFISEIIIPNHVKEIGAYAFAGCSKATSITFQGGGVDFITVGDYAFFENTAAKTLNFMEGSKVASVGAYAFAGCETIRELVIPATMAYIGDYAFADCTSISSIEFAENGADLEFGNYSFFNCLGLKEVTLPASLVTLQLGVFEGCFNLANVFVNDNNQNYCDVDGVVFTKDMKEICFYPMGRTGNYTLPDATEIINGNIFKNNTNLTEFTFGANITTIGASAFENCTNLASVIFLPSDKPLTFGDYAFANCTALTEFEVPARATVISNGLLKNAQYITEITLHDGITSVGDYAFQATAVTVCDIPASVVNLGAYAFANTPITEVEIPATLVTLGAYAFANCSDLATIEYEKQGDAIAAQITSVPEGAFMGTMIESFYIPSSVTVIGAHAFDGCSQLADVTFELGGTQDLIIGSFVDYRSLTQDQIDNEEYMGEYESFAFRQTSIEEIVLPARTTIIGVGAFMGNASLTSVTFEENASVPVRLKNIGGAAFQETGISSFVIPNTVENLPVIAADIPQTLGIGQSAFAYCEDLTSITFEKGGKAGTLTIGAYAFDGTSMETFEFPARLGAAQGAGGVIFNGIEHVTWMNYRWYSGIPNSTSMKSYTVEDGNPYFSAQDGILYNQDKTSVILSPRGNVLAEGATTVNIPATVTYVGYKAFAYSNLESITFLSGDKNVVFEQYAFSYANTTEIVLPEKLTNIPNNCFERMPNIEYLKIPANVMGSIGRYAFWVCKSLKEVEFDSNLKANTISDYAFQNCSKLERIKIPASILSIGSGAFDACLSLAEIDFSESQVQSIGTVAFRQTALQTVVLPDSLEKVTDRVFANCEKLRSVTISSKLESIYPLFFYMDATWGDHMTYALGMEEVIVPDGHPNYKSVDGVVYSKDGSQLLYWPTAKPIHLTTKGVGGETVVYDDGALSFASTVTAIGDYAFAANPNVKSVTLHKNIESIGNFAFYAKSRVTEFTLSIDEGSKLSTIGSNALRNAATLGDFTLPASVTSIGRYALASTNITKLTFPTGSQLTTIGPYAFRANTSITSVNIPASVEEIGDYAFYGCSGLTSVKFEAGSKLSYLGIGVFYNCSKLAEAELPSTVEDIPYCTFYQCPIKTFEMPAAISEIGDYAFYGAQWTSVTVPAGVESIGFYAFGNNKLLEEINLPDTVVTIKDGAFYNCSKLTEIVIPDSVTTLGTNEEDENVFYGCTSLASVTLPDKLTEIVPNLFKGLKNLETIEIPGAVTSIGAYAFDGCTNLAEISIGIGLETIGEYAFRNCDLQTIALPGTLTSIGLGAFEGNKAMQSIDLAPDNLDYKMINGILYNFAETKLISLPAGVSGEVIVPSTVTQLADGAFAGTAVTSVTLPEGLLEINDYLFQNCSGLETVVIPSTVTKIGRYAFANCTNLTNVELPANLTTIYKYAFYGSGLTDVTIGKFVTTIYKAAFAECADLETLTFEEGGRERLQLGAYDIKVDGKWVWDYIDDGEGVFQNCTSLKKVVIPNRVRNDIESAKAFIMDFYGIEAYSFSGCTSLETLEFSTEGDNSLLTSSLGIGQYAFAYCEKLTSVHFPETVGDNPYWCWDAGEECLYNTYAFSTGAFSYCTNLKTVTFSPAKSTTSYSFYDYVFEYTAIEEFTFPNLPTWYIGSGVLRGTLISSLEIPEIDPDYGYMSWAYMFQDCKNVTSFNAATTRDGSAISYSTGMFMNSGLAGDIVIPANVNIGNSSKLFSGTAITSITIEKGMTTYINKQAFENCKQLTSVTLPDNLTRIYEKAFSGCTAITTLNVPATVTCIQASAFNGWTSAQTIVMGIEQSAIPAYKNTTTGWNKNWRSGCNANIYGPTSADLWVF